MCISGGGLHSLVGQRSLLGGADVRKLTLEEGGVLADVKWQCDLREL